jgi:hypothetical protein
MKDTNTPGRALAAYFRPMAQQKRVTIPLTALPSRTVEETVAEKDYALVCQALGRWRSTKGSVTGSIGSSACQSA